MSAIERCPETQTIIDRLSAINRERPRIELGRAEDAIHAHVRAGGLAPRPIRWTVDAEDAFLTAAYLPACAVWEALAGETLTPQDTAAQINAWNAARGAAWSVAWTPAEAAARRFALQRARFRRHQRRAAAIKGSWTREWSAAATAVRCAALSALVPYVRMSFSRANLLNRELAAWLPLLDAFDAGLWLFWVLEDTVIAVPRPKLRSEGGRLHCGTGPAVSWPRGAQYYCWRGVQVPARVILRPNTIEARTILVERNAEVRRIMLERVGYLRVLLELGAVPIQTDQCGALYRIDLMGEELLALVHVTNATPEPDGTRKRYVLRVPPTVRTAREAVAWTFGMSAKTYRPARET